MIPKKISPHVQTHTTNKFIFQLNRMRSIQTLSLFDYIITHRVRNVWILNFKLPWRFKCYTNSISFFSFFTGTFSQF